MSFTLQLGGINLMEEIATIFDHIIDDKETIGLFNHSVFHFPTRDKRHDMLLEKS